MTDDAIPDVQSVAITIPLDEFCADASRTDNRVEHLAAFAYRERAAKRHHDTAAAYAERYAALHRSPTA